MGASGEISMMRSESRFQSRPWGSVAGLAMAVALGAAGAVASVESQAEEHSRPLAAGERFESDISIDDRHVFSLPEPPGDAWWRVVVEQRGIDVWVEVRENGSATASLNHYRDRFEQEVFRVPGTVDSLAIQPVSGAERSGRYEIELQMPIDESPVRLRIERRLTEGAKVAHGSESPALRRAAELYESVADELESAEVAAVFDRPEAERAKALFSAANHRRVLGDSEQAARLYGRAADIWRDLDDPGWLAACLLGLGQSERKNGHPEKARAVLEEAMLLWPLAESRDAETAHTLTSLGLIAHVDGDYPEALEHYGQALDIHRQAGREREQARLLNNISNVQSRLGVASSALKDQLESVEIFRRLGDKRNEMGALNNLADLYRRMMDPEAALRIFDQVGDLAELLGDARWQGRALNHRGITYLGMGSLDRAVEDLEAALQLRRTTGDRRGELYTLSNLGDAEFHRGDLERARGHLRSALALEVEGEGRTLAMVQARSARVDALLGETEADEQTGVGEVFDQALDLLGQRGDLEAAAHAHYLRAQAETGRSRLEVAERSAGQALEKWRALKNPSGEMLALAMLGRIARHRGNWTEASEHLEQAIQRIESGRASLSNPNLRAAYLASRREVYELQLQTLVDLHREHPGGGHLQAAVELGERARSRWLLDLVLDARSGSERPRVGVMERRRSLISRLGLLVRRQELILLGHRRPIPGENLSGAIADLRSELDLIDAQVSLETVRGAPLGEAPKSLSIAEIRSLLDHETVLLQYSMGRDAGHLVVVDSQGESHFELPGRDVIESLANRAHRALATVGGASAGCGGALAELSEVILGSGLSRAEGKRLAILPDGALHYVPFAALCLPQDTEQDGAPEMRLVDRFESVRLASAAVLAADRRAAANRIWQPERQSLVVVADPVFDRRDARFGTTDEDDAGIASAIQDALPVALTRGVDQAPAVFGRLPGSRREAEVISAHLPAERLELALDFRASRDAVEQALGDKSVIHFATHGLIDTQFPELSGLVLSQFHSDGRRRADGFLRVYDIFELDLDAELVVLSGCGTALGKHLRGESFQGLTSAFVHAGARRVLASLWPIADRATAELMDHFYRALWVDGMAPSAALRQAQLEMIQDRRFRDPYYWAGFVLQGDWR